MDLNVLLNEGISTPSKSKLERVADILNAPGRRLWLGKKVSSVKTANGFELQHDTEYRSGLSILKKQIELFNGSPPLGPIFSLLTLGVYGLISIPAAVTSAIGIPLKLIAIKTNEQSKASSTAMLRFYNLDAEEERNIKIIHQKEDLKSKYQDLLKQAASKNIVDPEKELKFTAKDHPAKDAVTIKLKDVQEKISKFSESIEDLKYRNTMIHKAKSLAMKEFNDINQKSKKT